MIKNLLGNHWFALVVGSLFVSLSQISHATLIKKDANKGSDLVPTGMGYGVHSNQAPSIVSNRTLVPQNGINYHGGPLMGTTTATIPNVYIIWYGNWASNTATTLIPTFMSGVGTSPYYHINSTYVNGSGAPVMPVVHYPVADAHDNYTYGTHIPSQSYIGNIVANAINNHQLPLDANGIYFVLTSADVYLPGFCSSYCGWHTYRRINNVNIKYAFIGNAASQCPNGCTAQRTSPNGNFGADGMISVIAHELEETVTDPNLNAWYDSFGRENADKCAWSFGTTHVASNGSKYNMIINGLQLLIQRNWVNAAGGYCALSY